MITFLSKYKLSFLGIVIGAATGYAYYYYIGCSSGTCPITSKPLNSTIYGALLGLFLFTSFIKDKSNTNHTNDETI